LCADAKKEILVAVASLVVHCCAVKKNVVVASQLYDVADVQFTVEWTERENRFSLSLVESRQPQTAVQFNLCGNKVKIM